ncbi:MAG TPA: L-threonylcarbamoyladenylate synthase [Saprospiraceae bacterium]|nr:L-threonylcarbamoyladenylate synthase [Saprospiraceae bacterium]
MSENGKFSEDLKNCIQALELGQTILYPTDTIWGIGGDALNPLVYEKIFQIKARPATKSFILLVDSIEMLYQYVDKIHPRIDLLLSLYDKPLTIVYQNIKSLPDAAILNNTVAMRICKDPFCNSLIKTFGRPIISTSANISGQKPAHSYNQISSDIKSQIDYIVKHRQSENISSGPSALAKYNDDGELEFLR